MKKAQMEILGLVIVMILISIGVLFAVKYVILAPDKNIKGEFTQRNIAQNTLNVLLNTDVECNDAFVSIQDLLVDCIRFGGIISCSGKVSCEYSKAKINKIFTETLIKWGNNFYFEAEGDSGEEIKIDQDNGIEPCPGEKKTGIQPLPYGMTIKLEICN